MEELELENSEVGSVGGSGNGQGSEVVVESELEDLDRLELLNEFVKSDPS